MEFLVMLGAWIFVLIYLSGISGISGVSRNFRIKTVNKVLFNKFCSNFTFEW
jgi:hypothetical protein